MEFKSAPLGNGAASYGIISQYKVICIELNWTRVSLPTSQVGRGTSNGQAWSSEPERCGSEVPS